MKKNLLKYIFFISILFVAFTNWKIAQETKAAEASFVKFKIPGKITVNLNKGKYILYKINEDKNNYSVNKQLPDRGMNKEIVITQNYEPVVRSSSRTLFNDISYESIGAFTIAEDSEVVISSSINYVGNSYLAYKESKAGDLTEMVRYIYLYTFSISILLISGLIILIKKIKSKISY